jgi:hypothetical protein
MIQDWKYHPETLQWEYMPADAVVFGDGTIITQHCGCRCKPCAAIYQSSRAFERDVPGHCLTFPCTGGQRLWIAHWEGKRLGEDTNPEAAMRLVEAKAEELRRAREVADLEALG